MTLDKTFINYTTRGWVRESSLLVSDKESLWDTFIDHDHCKLWLLPLWVNLGDHFFKLRDLRCQNLVTLCITDTIPINHEVSGQVSLMLPLELLDSFSDAFLHALLNNFLSLFLNQIVAVVLWHLLICRCWETHNWLGTSMAHVNPDQHSPLCIQRLWELEVIEVTTCFRVYLSQDVGRFWQIKLEPVSRGYHLTWHAVLVHHFFEGLIGTFLLQQKYDHGWMSDFTTSEHVVSELFI